MRIHSPLTPATALLLVISGLGCGGGGRAPATEPATPTETAAITPEAAQDGCLAMFQRQRECTDVFIPALVGWRVELDVPAGVAEADRTDGRDALVARAKAEWASSNSDDQLAELCAGIVSSIPADQLGPMVEVGRRCTAATTCEAYTTCIEPAQRQRLAAQRAAEAGAAP